MRFKTFLNEAPDKNIRELNHLIEAVATDCTPFLRASEGLPLYRGFDLPTSSFSLELHRHPKNRAPRDSDDGFNCTFNAMAEAALGIADYRAQVLFTTGSWLQTTDYGVRHFVFPVGNFGYSWGERITDSYTDGDKIYAVVGAKVAQALKVDINDYPEYATGRFYQQVNEMLNFGHVANLWKYPKATHLAWGEVLVRNSHELSPQHRDVNVLIPLLRKAFAAAFDELFQTDGLAQGIAAKREIMIHRSGGFYAIPAARVARTRELMDSTPASVVGGPDVTRETYDWLLSKIKFARVP